MFTNMKKWKKVILCVCVCLSRSVSLGRKNDLLMSEDFISDSEQDIPSVSKTGEYELGLSGASEAQPASGFVGRHNMLPHCPPPAIDQTPPALLLVSTLDGKLTALNPVTGSILWQHDDGSPLLSSSMPQIKCTIQSNAGPLELQLVPAVDGSLYAQTGMDLTLLPFTVDELIKPDFPVSSDMAFSGQRTLEMLTLSARTGSRLSFCRGDSCQKYENVIEDELLFFTKSVISVVASSVGTEMFRFSVGTSGLYKQPGSCRTGRGEAAPRPSFTLPTGLVQGLHTNGTEVWTTKLPAQILKAWQLIRGTLTELDLFSSEYTPALPATVLGSDFAYMGHSLGRFFIHQSPDRHKRVLDYIQHAAGQEGRDLPKSLLGLLQKGGVQWSSTPPLEQERLMLCHPTVVPSPLADTPLSDGCKVTSLVLSPNNHSTPIDASVVQARSNAPVMPYHHYEHGSFLPVPDPMRGKEVCLVGRNMSRALDFFYNAKDTQNGWRGYVLSKASFLIATVLTMALPAMLYRKEVGSFFGVQRYDGTVGRLEAETQSDETNALVSFIPGNVAVTVTTPPVQLLPVDDKFLEIEDGVYHLQKRDYTVIGILGKGGFGVVYEVQRPLPNPSTRLALKVIKIHGSVLGSKANTEVEYLADLNHSNIVRYYHSQFVYYKPSEMKRCFDLLARRFQGQLDDEETEDTDSEEEDSTDLAAGSGDNRVDNSGEQLAITNGNGYAESDNFTSGSSIQFTDDTNNSSILFADDTNNSSILFADNSCDDDNGKLSVGISASSRSNVFGKTEVKNISEQEVKLKVSSISDDESYVGGKNPFFRNPGDSRGNSDEADWDTTVETPEQSAIKEQENRMVVRKPSVQEEISSEDNKIQILPKVEEKAEPYLMILTEVCSKTTLTDWLAENQVRTIETIRTFFLCMVRAMREIHDKGLMHRDLKPSNMFLSCKPGEPGLKVGDFGLMKTHDHAPESDSDCDDAASDHDVAQVEPNHTVGAGTKSYSSPEQRSSKTYDPKTDIYSMGLILLEMLQPMKTAFERLHTFDQARNLIFPAGFEGKFPDEYALIREMLDPDPLKRPTCQGLLVKPPLNTLESAHVLKGIAEADHYTLPRPSSARRHRRTSSNVSTGSGRG